MPDASHTLSDKPYSIRAHSLIWTEHVTRSVHSLCMTPDDGVLGRCPNCATKITRAWLLIEYENTEGQTGIWAECPECDDVVEPE